MSKSSHCTEILTKNTHNVPKKTTKKTHDVIKTLFKENLI